MATTITTPRPRLVVVNHYPAFLALLLREAGYEVLIPSPQDDPHLFVTATRPALVVLDAPLQEAALKTLDNLRLDPATAATPVVVCTAVPWSFERLAGREAERLYLLAKPFRLAHLLGVLEVALPAPPPASRRPTRVSG
jgi:DNA-binding response OmpR family regulator